MALTFSVSSKVCCYQKLGCELQEMCELDLGLLREGLYPVLASRDDALLQDVGGVLEEGLKCVEVCLLRSPEQLGFVQMQRCQHWEPCATVLEY